MLWAELSPCRFYRGQDLKEGYGREYLPSALERKLSSGWPGAGLAVCVPEDETLARDPRSGLERKHQLREAIPQRSMKGVTGTARGKEGGKLSHLQNRWIHQPVRVIQERPRRRLFERHFPVSVFPDKVVLRPLAVALPELDGRGVAGNLFAACFECAGARWH